MTVNIRAIYQVDPGFPATQQSSISVRYQVGSLIVDAEGGQPQQSDVDAILNPAAAIVDQATLNAALAAPGSVVRGLALVVLDIAKGVVPINANYTQAQLLAAIQQRMR